MRNSPTRRSIPAVGAAASTTQKNQTNEQHAPTYGIIPAAVIAAGLTGPVAWSAPGDLDPTFGSVGFAELPQDLSGAVWALEALSDKYQAAGGVEYCGYYYYYCDADLDFATSLSGSGVVDPAYSPAIPGGVRNPVFAWQKDGRLVGIGRNSAVADANQIFRLATDGSLDPTFGTNGMVTIDLATINYAYAVTVDPDGRIVIEGIQGNTPVLLRLMPDGGWDASFGTNGVARGAVGAPLYSSTDIVRTPDGAYRMLGGGEPGCNVHGVAASGSADSAFGNSGSVGLTKIVGANFSCTGLDVLPDGRLVVAGRDDAGGAVVRLSANGTLDATFASDAGAYLSTISAIAVSASGSVLVAGPDRDGLPGIVVAHLLPNGRVDTAFGADGKAWIDVQSDIGSYAEARVLVAPSDESILVGGILQRSYWYSGASKPYIARLTMSGAGPGVVGIKTTDVQAQESDRQATIVVRRTGGSTGAVSVGYRTEAQSSGGAAIEGEDFEPVQGRLEWASGESGDKTIVVPIIADPGKYETNEFFNVTLEEPVGGGLGKSAGQVTILGDGYPHGAFRISAGTPEVSESDSTATFFVSRIDGGSGAVSVTVEPVDGTATQGTDFVASPVILTWADGVVSRKAVTVHISMDNIREPDETFSMMLTDPTGGAVIVPDAATAAVTIQDSRQSSGSKSGGGMVGLISLLLLGIAALARQFRIGAGVTVSVTRQPSSPPAEQQVAESRG